MERQKNIKEAEASLVPLEQNEEWRAYREKTDKQNGYYHLYQEFWKERRRAEGSWAKNEPYDSYWLEVNPDDLTNEDFFYYLLGIGQEWEDKDGKEVKKLESEEAEKVLKNEYWPRIEHHLREAGVGAAERARKMGQRIRSEEEQKAFQKNFEKHDSRANFYQWLLNTVKLEAPRMAMHK